MSPLPSAPARSRTAPPRAEVRHLVIGPQAHGVVRHGLGLFDAARRRGADELEHRLVRAQSVESVGSVESRDFGTGRTAPGAPAAGAPADPAAGTEAPAGVLHVSFTDALFGPDPQAAVDAVLRLRGSHLLSVGPHDVPQPQEGHERFARRSRAYARLLGQADLVIAHSEHEAGQLRELGGAQPGGRGAIRVVPLPLEDPAAAPGAAASPAASSAGPAPESRPSEAGPGSPCVGVLGFVYPGKGLEDVIDQVPPGTRVRAIGGVAAGHDDEAAGLGERAARRGVAFEITGYVPEAELAAELAAADVPVCPHRHVSASGSLNTWIAHGRIPLVADGPYMREVDERWPGRVVRRDREELGEALRELLADPGRTRAVQAAPSWGWPQVAAAYETAWAEAAR